MTPADPWYPPTPPGVPPDLAVPDTRYRVRVLVVLAGLVLFFCFYLALTAGSLYAIFKAWTYRAPDKERDDFLWRLILVVGPALLFLFLLKGLFKRQRVEKSLLVRVHPEEHPRLFAFIRRVCADTGAPLPHRVYLDPNVNAAVFYNSSVVSLVWPTRKNLLIGLGLVNVLNLSEFKAVLAHEFGHFGQRSMKVGPYVYVANRIMTDIVYGRDKLDELLAVWRQLDLRVSWLAWGFSGVLWLLRQLLAGSFKAINALHSSLSRQMEFNADLVAVSVSGSDALVNGLSRLDFAGASLDQAMTELRTAAQHRLYTTDLYHHHRQAAAYLRKVRKEPHLGEPPPLPEDPTRSARVFEPGEDGIPLMWATHPSNFDREQNAKRRYVRAALDDRSPWGLFDDPRAVCETMTRRFYRELAEVPEDVPLTLAEQVQAFIDAEHAETTYDERYHALYDGRLLETFDVAELAREARDNPWDEGKLSEAHARLFTDELKEWMKGHDRRNEEFQLLQALDQGEAAAPEGRFDFRGQSHAAGDVAGLLKQVDEELAKDRQWLDDLDRQVFRVYYRMALGLGEEPARELKERYEFHLAAQHIISQLMEPEAEVQAATQFLAGQTELEADAFRQICEIFRKAHRVLYANLKAAGDLRLPALKHLTAGQTLRAFLLEKPLVHALVEGSSLDGAWVNNFLNQFGEVQEKLRRLHFKSLGGILALQEKVAREWSARRAAGATAEPVGQESPAGA
jgi:Zn-dependent protease with chaperone function